MSMLNLTATLKDRHLIEKIADRAVERIATLNVGLYRHNYCVYELTITHLNGCPLNLQKLLKAPNFDFLHDILGIRKNIDKRTGKLRNCFLPRSAKP